MYVEVLASVGNANVKPSHYIANTDWYNSLASTTHYSTIINTSESACVGYFSKNV